MTILFYVVAALVILALVTVTVLNAMADNERYEFMIYLAVACAAGALLYTLP